MIGELRGLTPQAEVMRPPRNTHYQVLKGQVPEVVYVPRQSRVIMGINSYGDIVFLPLPGMKWDKIDPALLPHFYHGAQRLFDQRTHSYETARHKKTTTVSRKVGQGDPTHRLPKDSGFMFRTTKRDIYRERKDNELKRKLLELGIDEHKLFLLIHSATHNQMLLETERVKKKKKTSKKDYSISAPFLLFEKKHRKKKATAGNIYKYRR